MNLGNQQDVQKRNKALKGEQARVRNALQWVLSDERGRLYLGELVRESQALERTHGADADSIMFTDGKKAMGFKVLNDVRAVDDKHFGTLVASVFAKPGEKDGGTADLDPE